MKQSSTNGAIELDQNVEIEANKVFALGTESTNMLQNIEHVIGKSISAAEYTLGHKSPLEITEPIPKFHTRYSSDNASDLTITTSGDRNDVSDHCDVEMN